MYCMVYLHHIKKKCFKNVQAMQSRKGFLLIELIVSIGLFLIVALMTSGAIASLLSASRYSKAEEVLASNLELIIEDISRNARTGTLYNCMSGSNPPSNPGVMDCSNGGNVFSFRTTNGIWTSYYLLNGKLMKRSGTSTALSLTSAPITIRSFNVRVIGSDLTDNLQPVASLSIEGSIQIRPSQEKRMNFQTSVTQRRLDVQ
jgi:type II secretory pathway pseudopilin PulG